MGKTEENAPPNMLLQALLLFTVVMAGALTNIMKQVASKPMVHYSYVIQLTASAVNIPFCGAGLFFFWRRGEVPSYQFEFVKTARFKGLVAIWAFFFAISSGDSFGDVLGMICTPFVAGPIHSLLSNCTPIYLMLLSLTFMGKRYSRDQCLGMLCIAAAVGTGVIPVFAGGVKGGTDPTYATILAISCFGNAVSFILKEVLFSRFQGWKASSGIDDGRGLHIFVVNFLCALTNLPLTLAFIPLNKALGQMGDMNFSQYFAGAWRCLSDGDCGEDAVGGEHAALLVAAYVLLNFFWQLAMLLSVKQSGSLLTFIALKGVFPTSAVLFAYVDWPLLGTTPMHALTALSIAILLPGIYIFNTATMAQERRAMKNLSDATCCWPLCRGAPAEDTVERPLLQKRSNSNPDLNNAELSDVIRFQRSKSVHAMDARYRNPEFACPYHTCPNARSYNGAPCSTQMSLLALRDGVKVC